MSRWKCRTQYIAKNSPSGDHRTTLSGHIFASDACIDNRKKILNSNVFFTCFPTLRPTSGWDRFVILGHPSKFQRVSHFGFVTAATSLKGSQPNFARCLAISWASTLYIHFRGFLPRNGILPCATFTLRPSLALFGSVTARHSSSVRQPNFAAMNRGRHLYSAGRPSRWSLAHILVQWSVCLLHLFILSTFTASVENLKLSLFVIWVWQTTTNVWNCRLLVGSKLQLRCIDFYIILVLLILAINQAINR